MPMTITEMFWLFVLFSLSGWLLECIYRSLRAKRFVNPGFLRGPYLPIYGIGAVLIVFCRYHLQESLILLKGLAYLSTVSGLELINLSDLYLKTINFIIKCVVYLSVVVGLEFITGFIFEGLLCIRLWDYSKERYRIKNYVCFTYSIYWLILALCVEYVLLPFSLMLLHQLPPVMTGAFIMVMMEVMFIDMMIKVAGTIPAKGPVMLTEKEIQDRLEAFVAISEPLCAHPDVARLADFKHHRETNRLEHSMEVAWLSYQIARKLSLDSTATVRGALLHDLFFYDWLYEGPRFHGFRHPKISLENAEKITSLSPKERDIIKKHMWPLTPLPPRYKESWVVCLVDTYCTLKEYILIFKSVYEE